MKKWRCTVCGYIHEGPEPPEVCPVCNAPRGKFVEVTEEAPQAAKSAPAQTTKPSGPYELFTDLLHKNHAHPISVHFPNGVLPVAVIFVALAIFFSHTGLGNAAYYNLLFVMLVMPMVLFSGYVSWHKRYQGAMSSIFVTKIICAAVVTVTALVLLIWRFTNPDILSSDSPNRWLFLLTHIIMLAAAGTAGHLGGKLVFGKR